MILAGRSKDQNGILHMGPNINLGLLNINDGEAKSLTAWTKIWSRDVDNKLESQFRMCLQHDSENIHSFPRKTTLKGYLNAVGPLVCCESSFWLYRLSLIFELHTFWMRHLTSPFDIFLTHSDCTIVDRGIVLIWRPFMSGICCLTRYQWESSMTPSESWVIGSSGIHPIVRRSCCDLCKPPSRWYQCCMLLCNLIM